MPLNNRTDTYETYSNHFSPESEFQQDSYTTNL
jgi:hypothetical protein